MSFPRNSRKSFPKRFSEQINVGRVKIQGTQFARQCAGIILISDVVFRLGFWTQYNNGVVRKPKTVNFPQKGWLSAGKVIRIELI